MTADEYFEVTFEGDHMELIDGVMVLDEPRPLHQLVCGRLYLALANWANEPPGDGLPILPSRGAVQAAAVTPWRSATRSTRSPMMRDTSKSFGV